MPFNTAPGLGFPQFQFGDVVGPDGSQYKILRKLGWGMNFSTWLVQDQRFFTLDDYRFYILRRAGLRSSWRSRRSQATARI